MTPTLRRLPSSERCYERRGSSSTPRENKCIELLNEKLVFSILNASSWYCQIEMDYRNINRTAFATHHGRLLYTVTSLALKNALAPFQKAIEVILAFLKWQSAILYIDKVVIFSNLLQQHFSHTEEFLILLMDESLTLEFRNCYFFCKSIGCLC